MQQQQQPPPPAPGPVFDEISLRAGLPSPVLPWSMPLPPRPMKPKRRRSWPALLGFIATLLVLITICGVITTLHDHYASGNTPRPAATATQ